MNENNLKVLKNFTRINQGICVKAGETIYTKNPENTIVGIYDSDEPFEKDFCIYDLPAFLNALTIFKDPVLEFKDSYVEISSGGNSIKYFYSSPDVVDTLTERNIKIIESAYSTLKDVFVLDEQTLSSIFKASKILNLEHVRITPEKIELVDKYENNSTNSVSFSIKTDEDFDSVLLNVNNLVMIPGAYRVKVGERMTGFESIIDSVLTYVVANLSQ
jgi:hypothetical protein